VVSAGWIISWVVGVDPDRPAGHALSSSCCWCCSSRCHRCCCAWSSVRDATIRSFERNTILIYHLYWIQRCH
jgi:hypothetical protein